MEVLLQLSGWALTPVAPVVVHVPGRGFIVQSQVFTSLHHSYKLKKGKKKKRNNKKLWIHFSMTKPCGIFFWMLIGILIAI